MEENYYDILEINKNASPEIIEKAYKTLVKKYHPDLQQNNYKNNYEEKIKKINEAYETLSNPEKKYNYDLYLKKFEISKDEYNKLYNENINLKNEINYLKNNLFQIKNNLNHFDNKNQFVQRKHYPFNLTYNNDYKTSFNNINLKNNYKNFFKNILAIFLTILFFIILIFILWNIPFTKNYFINLYNNNDALKLIINIFFNIFK